MKNIIIDSEILNSHCIVDLDAVIILMSDFDEEDKAAEIQAYYSGRDWGVPIVKLESEGCKGVVNAVFLYIRYMVESLQKKKLDEYSFIIDDEIVKKLLNGNVPCSSEELK